MKRLIHITHNDDLYEIVFSSRTIHRITRYSSDAQIGCNLLFDEIHQGLKDKIITEIDKHEQDH